MREIVSSDEQIRSLYKDGACAPYRKIEGWVGYLGVVIEHRDTGMVACPICGGWYEHVGSHAALKHKIKSPELKARWGLGVSDPTCSVSLSKRLSIIAEQNGAGARAWLLNKGKTRLVKKYSPHSPAYLNKHAICDDQIATRYWAVSDRIGRQPSRKDMIREDWAALKVIVRRYGWKEFQVKMGVTPRISPKALTRSGIISDIRMVAEKTGRIPNYRDFTGKIRIGRTEQKSIREYFGSLAQALAAAGVVKAS